MLPAGNGQGPRHHLLQQCSIALLFQPALTSPFIEFQYTAFSPSAALWDIFLQLLLSLIGFSLSLYSYEVYSSRFRLSTLFYLSAVYIVGAVNQPNSRRCGAYSVFGTIRSDYFKFFRIMIENFTALFGHKHQVLHPYTGIPCQIDSRLNRKNHSRFCLLLIC